MKIQHRIFLVAFLALFFLPRLGECYVTLSYKDVDLTKEMRIKLPKDTYLIHYDFEQDVDEFLEEQKLTGTAGLYQLVLNDGQAYRTAYLLAIGDNKQTMLEEKFVLADEKSQIELLQIYDLAQHELNSLLQEKYLTDGDFSYTRQINRGTLNAFLDVPQVEILEFSWPQPEFLLLGDKPGVCTEVRLSGNYFGLFLPAYLQIYAFEIDKKIICWPCFA